VNLVYDSEARFRFIRQQVCPREQNLVLLSSKCDAEVTNNKAGSRGTVLLKLTEMDTKHDAACLRQQSYLFHVDNL